MPLLEESAYFVPADIYHQVLTEEEKLERPSVCACVIVCKSHDH